MSGPKIISIVTVEEVIQICNVWLTRVDAEMNRWTEVGRRNDVISPDDEAENTKRRNKLSELLNSGQYVAVQKQAPLLIQRLQLDLDQRLEQAAQSRAAQQRMTRSLSITASSLLRRAASTGAALPVEVTEVLTAATGGQHRDDQETEQAISRAILLLAEDGEGATGFSPVGQQLIEDAAPESLHAWIIRTNAATDSDPRLAKADSMMARIRTLDASVSLQGFSARIQEIERQADAPDRGLRLDALCLDLKRLLDNSEQRNKVELQLTELKMEAEATGAFPELQAQFLHAVELASSGDLQNAAAWAGQIRELMDVRSRQNSAAQKRQTLIRGLEQLGYSVNSGMLPVWSSKKRLIVGKNKNSETGVEISGDLESGKCQVRPVAFENRGVRSPANDRDEETRWCSDLEEMQKQLASQGVALKIEASTPVGAAPLKVVSGAWTHDFDAASADDVARSNEMRRLP